MEQTNLVTLIGQIKTIEEVKSVNGRPFSGQLLTVVTERKSKVLDESTVLIAPELLEHPAEELEAHTAVLVAGYAQTVRNPDTGKVLVCVLACVVQKVRGAYWEPENKVQIAGTLAKKSTHRKTPQGREIADFLLKVPSVANKHNSCYIPCIAWGALAERMAEAEPGQQIRANGRLQSRNYNKMIGDKNVVRTAYEVSVNELG